MAREKSAVCGVCGRRWKQGAVKLTPYNLPIPLGSCYKVRRDEICDECREDIEKITKQKIIEIGEYINERIKRFRKAKFE